MREASWPWTILAVLASAWLLVVLFLSRIVGPLNPDEIYFSHTLWLTLQGKRQFLDFYSQHFPTYFALYDLLIPRERGDSLDFIWFVRLSNLVVLAAYIGILGAVFRRSGLFFLPLFLVLALVSRMIEVRTDTLGLLALNAAWGVLLIGESRRSVALATVFAIVAALFSARGLVMSMGFAVALAWRCWLSRDWRGLLAPGALAACSAAILLAACWANPGYASLIVKSTLLNPPNLLSSLSVGQRLFALDRLPQVLIAAIAMLLALVSLARGKQRAASGTIAAACAAQLLLIFLDPSPFPYVYAWAVVPSLAGLGLAEPMFKIGGRKLIAAAGILGASGIGAGILLYSRITGHEAPVGSNYRLLLDPPVRADAVREMPLKSLVSMMVSGDRQHSLANQLLVREELCGRVRASVLSAWQSHPICLPDATYYWFSIKWPNIGVEGPSPTQTRWFERIFERDPPSLVIWDIPGASTTLNPWAAGLLKRYEIEKGFAIRSDLTAPAKDSFDKAASRPHNDHS